MTIMKEGWKGFNKLSSGGTSLHNIAYFCLKPWLNVIRWNALWSEDLRRHLRLVKNCEHSREQWLQLRENMTFSCLSSWLEDNSHASSSVCCKRTFSISKVSTWGGQLCSTKSFPKISTKLPIAQDMTGQLSIANLFNKADEKPMRPCIIVNWW